MSRPINRYLLGRERLSRKDKEVNKDESDVALGLCKNVWSDKCNLAGYSVEELVLVVDIAFV
jgi:hypothetical protein